MTQQDALDILKLGQNVFLTGSPGSGKTFLLNKYIDCLKQSGKGVGITASTGIAATHMDGVTVHSWSGLGIKDRLTKNDIRKLLKKSYLRKRFKQTNILIIDEISMLHARQFDMLNRICQSFKGSAHPFGGMQIICSGDFFQLPPIERRGEAKFVTQSNVWQNMDIKICYLEEQHRHEDEGLRILLEHIRNNAIEKASALLMEKKQLEKLLLIEPTKLYTHNVDVDAINNLELRKIKEKEFVYRMSYWGNSKIITALIKSCLAPERLALKKGAQVMFVKNNFDKGYVNGTRGEVVGFNENNLPIVETLSGNRVVAMPAEWMVEEDGLIKAEIKQIPLRLAWAITVHKSQGMSLDAAEIDLSKCFVEGMGYVALSRLRSLAGLKLVGINELALCVDKNVLDLDGKFKQMSRQAVEDLEKMSVSERQEKQNQFFDSLPQVEPGEKKKKKKKISTYKQTEALVLEKLTIKEMAERRGMVEDTIISHLEKMISKKVELDLDYLRPDKERFEKIKVAFQGSDDWRLSPAKETLGDDFSYQELRLARLFLGMDEE